MLPSAYWLLGLFKPVSKYNTATLRQKKALNWTFSPQRCLEMYMFCALAESNHSPITDLEMIYNWANNSLISKGFDQMCTSGYMQLWSQNKL
jgi:hypothetical protein